MSVGCQRASASAAFSKMLLPLVGALVPPLRLGDRESDAMDIGDGSDISTSIGVPGTACSRPAKVCARAKAPLALFFRGCVGSGESMERSVRSVVEGKSVSPLVLTEHNGISLALNEPEPVTYGQHLLFIIAERTSPSLVAHT